MSTIEMGNSRMVRGALILLFCSGLATQSVRAEVRQNVVVLLDDSGSMADPMRSGPRVRKIDAAKRALMGVLAQVPDEAQVGLYALNSRGVRGNWIVPLGPIDRAQIRNAITQIRASGGTPLGRAMKVSADALLQARQRTHYGDYRLIIVTDGEAQDEDLVDRYLPDILQRQITVDVIGVSMAQNHSLATRVDHYRRADDPESLASAIEESLAETPLDPQDPDEASDFELLNGLPIEVAEAAIQGLTDIDNRPIGDGIAPDAGAGRDNSTASVPRATSPVVPGEPPGRGDRKDSQLTTVLLVGVMLMLVFVVRSVFRMSRRHR